jgi:hypothetical protein
MEDANIKTRQWFEMLNEYMYRTKYFNTSLRSLGQCIRRYTMSESVFMDFTIAGLLREKSPIYVFTNFSSDVFIAFEYLSRHRQDIHMDYQAPDVVMCCFGTYSVNAIYVHNGERHGDFFSHDSGIRIVVTCDPAMEKYCDMSLCCSVTESQINKRDYLRSIGDPLSNDDRFWAQVRATGWEPTPTNGMMMLLGAMISDDIGSREDAFYGDSYMLMLNLIDYGKRCTNELVYAKWLDVNGLCPAGPALKSKFIVKTSAFTRPSMISLSTPMGLCFLSINVHSELRYVRHTPSYKITVRVQHANCCYPSRLMHDLDAIGEYRLEIHPITYDSDSDYEDEINHYFTYNTNDDANSICDYRLAQILCQFDKYIHRMCPDVLGIVDGCDQCASVFCRCSWLFSRIVCIPETPVYLECRDLFTSHGYIDLRARYMKGDDVPEHVTMVEYNDFMVTRFPKLKFLLTKVGCSSYATRIDFIMNYHMVASSSRIVHQRRFLKSIGMRYWWDTSGKIRIILLGRDDGELFLQDIIMKYGLMHNQLVKGSIVGFPYFSDRHLQGHSIREILASARSFAHKLGYPVYKHDSGKQFREDTAHIQEEFSNIEEID